MNLPDSLYHILELPMHLYFSLLSVCIFSCYCPSLMWVIFYVKWHGLSREEQAKYYEIARKERQKHLEMYPHWNARDNYRIGLKKKKRKRDKSDDPGNLTRFFKFTRLFSFLCSGMAYPKRNRLNTTTWLRGNVPCTCKCTQDGLLGTIMPSTKRNAGKGTKLEQTAIVKVRGNSNKICGKNVCFVGFFSNQGLFFG